MVLFVKCSLFNSELFFRDYWVNSWYSKSTNGIDVEWSSFWEQMTLFAKFFETFFSYLGILDLLMDQTAWI